MENLSKVNKAVLVFLELGYKIDCNGNVTNPRGKVIRGNTANKGYRRTAVRLDGERYDAYFHKVQAYLKYGRIVFEKSIQVRHLNGTRADNRWDNIAIGTHSDNMMDIENSVRKEKALKANKASVLVNTVYNHEEVYKYYLECGRSRKKAMERFGIKSKSTIHAIIRKYAVD